MAGESRCVAVIPARYGSKRLPGKPLADLAGRPLVVHALQAARSAALVDRVVVATDDARIARVVRDAGGECVQPAGAFQSGSDRCAAAVAALGESPDVVLNVQGDQPLVRPGDLDALVQAARDGRADVTTGWRPLTDPSDARDPARVKVVCAADGRALYFSRQAIPAAGPWRLHVGVYAYRGDALTRFSALPRTPLERAEDLEQLRLLEHGLSIMTVPMGADCPSVDTPHDLERIRASLRDDTQGDR